MTWRRAAALICALTIVGTCRGWAGPASYDPKPWLDDLAMMRAALSTKYANLEWAVFDHEANLNDYFARAQTRIERATDAGGARAAFDGLVRRLGDGHVEIVWPQSRPPGRSHPSNICEEIGYGVDRAAPPLAALAHGYVPLKTQQSAVFPAGIIVSGAHHVGVLKIGLFSPRGSPALCEQAIAALAIPSNRTCDDSCSDRVDAWSSARMTEDFIAQIVVLEHAKIDTLLVDIAGNGGGSEWVEAAARILTPIRLQSERMDFVRGQQWAKEFADLERKLRAAAAAAAPNDRALLLKLADQVKAKRADASTPCDSMALWKGEHLKCSWLGEGFYASGLIASADPTRLRGKSWATAVFSPMEFPYREGVWRGPLVVLVDGDSASASEEFAALLQDNHAAVVIGAPTYGAGCGHTDGATPTMLRNSGGRLELPDCARIRADGSNEVRGIVPDLLVGWHRSDGPRLRAANLLATLREAVAKSSK